MRERRCEENKRWITRPACVKKEERGCREEREIEKRTFSLMAPGEYAVQGIKCHSMHDAPRSMHSLQYAVQCSAVHAQHTTQSDAGTAHNAARQAHWGVKQHQPKQHADLLFVSVVGQS